MMKSGFSGRNFERINILIALAGMILASGLSACSSTPPVAQPQTAQTAEQVSSAWQSKGGYTGQAGGGSSGDSGSSYSDKVNLPSAPLDTPLCGTAQHENAQTGARIYGRSLESGNSCVQSACFQPLTGTYIAQDNQITVCR